MQFGRITPEQAGVSADDVYSFIASLEKHNITSHDLILARGKDVFAEYYWDPFKSTFNHRMYSVSKSLVAIAVGFLCQDGLIDIDKPISDYFPDETANQPDERMRNQTVRDMMKMTTAKIEENWFADKPADRVRHYFKNPNMPSRPAGTIFQYDSGGAFIVCALVEKIVKKPIMQYLREKLFDKIGVSESAECLSCPGGRSWGDSGFIMTATDLLKIARFTLSYGKVDGKQILSEKFLREATSNLTDNNFTGVERYNNQGYGYYIWRTYENSFFFNGMGSQLAVCVPHKDLIMIYNGDNQGEDDFARELIVSGFFEKIVDKIKDEPLEKNVKANARLASFTSKLKLAAARGKAHSATEEKIGGKTYAIEPNNMNISSVCFTFSGNGGKLEYVKGKENKIIEFKMRQNAFGFFPECDYSDKIGTVGGGRPYADAVSAGWVKDNQLYIKVQIIDKYFGKCDMFFNFKGENADEVAIFMQKKAEDFLWRYEGYASGKRID